MADIFLSYATQDRPHVVTTSAALETQGYTVWWDTSLVAGKVYAETIKTEILTSSAVVVIWSEHAKSSEWVYSEAAEGAKQGKLICTYLPGFDPDDVPMPFNARHAIPVTDLTRLRQAVSLLAPAPEKLHPGLSAAPNSYTWWYTDDKRGHYREAFALALAPQDIPRAKANADDDFAYLHAARHGTIEAFELYLEAWPDGGYRAQAMHYINVIRTKIRLFADSVRGWHLREHSADHDPEWFLEYHTDGVIRQQRLAFPLEPRVRRIIEGNPR